MSKKRGGEVVLLDRIEPRILLIRGQRVVLDADLAELYGTSTKALNQAVKRNQERFPADFMFQLTADEAAAMRSQTVTAWPNAEPLPSSPGADLRSQTVTSSPKAESLPSSPGVDLRSQIATTSGTSSGMRSQIATASKRNARYLPYAFTEHGAIMAASVLNTPRAIEVSVYVVRAFVKLRELLLTHKGVAGKVAELERKVGSHDVAIQSLVTAIRRLMEPPPAPPRPRIGFHAAQENGRAP